MFGYTRLALALFLTLTGSSQALGQTPVAGTGPETQAAFGQAAVRVMKTLDCASGPSAARVCQSPPRFNDTGINHCSDTHFYGMGCPLSLYPGQDGDYGRDTTHPEAEDGYAGFSFTRLDTKGKALSGQARSWACVRDNVTGLIWENKREEGVHDVNARYDNQSSDQPGEHVSTLVKRANQEKWCGFKDWRLPGVLELQSLVNYEIPFPGPTREAAFFPLTLNDAHWTADNDRRGSGKTWTVSFSDGGVDSFPKTHRYPARLVRGTAPRPVHFYISKDGQEVTDEATGLVWKRCVEGMKWDGAGCSGHPQYFTWYEALQSVVPAPPGRPGWRVPNVKEMSSLIDPAATGTLAVNTLVFPGTPNDMFWTSSPYTLDTFYGWVVQSFYGSAYFTYLEDNAALRLVRDRQ